MQWRDVFLMITGQSCLLKIRKPTKYEKFQRKMLNMGLIMLVPIGMNKQRRAAKSYMKLSAYSRDGLIKQFEYVKFTPEPDEYGVK